MQSFFYLLALLSVAQAIIPGKVQTAEISDGITLNYSIYEGSMHFEAVVINKGAIAIGIGGNKMQGIDVAHIWYENNDTWVVDRSYINPTGGLVVQTDIARGGTEDFVENGSKYDVTTGAWKTSVSRKLVTGDIYDVDIVDGKEIQISIALFDSHTNWGNKHTKVVYKTVKITSGSVDDTKDPNDTKDTQSEVDKSFSLNTSLYLTSTIILFFLF